MAFMTARIYNIEAPVGDNQPNLRGDVQLVQALLTEVNRTLVRDRFGPAAALEVTGQYGPPTREWTLAFQRMANARTPGMFVIDGKIHPLPFDIDHDWTSKIAGGKRYALWLLNVLLLGRAPQAHRDMAARLNLREAGLPEP